MTKNIFQNFLMQRDLNLLHLIEIIRKKQNSSAKLFMESPTISCYFCISKKIFIIALFLLNFRLWRESDTGSLVYYLTEITGLGSTGLKGFLIREYLLLINIRLDILESGLDCYKCRIKKPSYINLKLIYRRIIFQ